MAKAYTSAKPRVACEIAADRIIAARLAETGGMLDTCVSQDLPPGSVVPDLIESNLRERESVFQALRNTLGTVGGRSRDLIAILPDAAVRVVLLDFETLPANREEAEAVVRFRLKKSLPFDVDKAKVSYQSQTSTTGLRVIAAVALNTVVDDYESAFREAGYSPGIVIPSTLAALGMAEGSGPTLIVKVDSRTTSIAIMDKQQLLLFRTLENARGSAITGERLAEEVYPSVVFFQDTYHMNIDRIFVAGVPDLGAAAPALRAQTGAEVEELVGSSQLGAKAASVPKWRTAGVLGALLS